jgi:hypothetical protein
VCGAVALRAFRSVSERIFVKPLFTSDQPTCASDCFGLGKYEREEMERLDYLRARVAAP